VIPEFRSEWECLKLVFGVLGRDRGPWERVSFSHIETKHLEQYRKQKYAEREKPDTAEVA